MSTKSLSPECTLSHYFEEVYLPQKNASHQISRETARRQRNHIRKFLRFAGEDVRCRDVDHSLVDCFAAWMAQRGSGSDSRQAVTVVRSVIRHWNPDQISSRRKARVERAEIPGSIEVTGGEQFDGAEYLLANVYLNRYEPTALRSHSPYAKRVYHLTLQCFDKFLGRSATLDDLNDENVSDFEAWRLKKGLSERTVNKDVFNLLSLWRWSHGKGLVESRPAQCLIG